MVALFLQVIPGLLHVLDDTANPRVQAHAGAALVNFCEECPKHILLLYLDETLRKLEIVLQARLQDVRLRLSISLLVFTLFFHFTEPTASIYILI